MSTALLSSLTLGGIAFLVIAAFAANKLDQHRQERARRAALHRDRARDLNFIIEVLPRDPLRGDMLKLLFNNVVLHLQNAVDLDPHNRELRVRLEEMSTACKVIMKGGEVPQAPLPGSIGEQLKDAQRALKILKDFILQQHKVGVLTKAGAAKYIKLLPDINLRVMCDGLIGQAKHNLREGHKSLAIHYYQLAYNELLKHNKGNKHGEEMLELGVLIKELKTAQEEAIAAGATDPDAPAEAG